VTRPRVLIADDHQDLATAVAEGLGTEGFEATAVCEPEAALEAVRAGHHDALVTDLRMPGHDGFELLAASRAAAPEAPVIIMTAFSAIDSAIEAIRRGAYHYLTKPFRVAELALFLRRALDEGKVRRESRAMARSSGRPLDSLVGQSAAMRRVADLVRRVADADVPVLLLGETGTGKGVVARALHGESTRAARPFVSVNCAALPEALLESELFGHARGAFTGASSARSGLFAAAEGGTLFLDEVGDLAPALQGKLLAVLETGRYRAVGEDHERQADVRIVAATHRDLSASSTFRQDLRFRLEVVAVELPALRHRKEDIPALVQHFLLVSTERHPASPAVAVSREALERLLAAPWPGNVRELQHVIERAVVLAQGPELGLPDLPPALAAGRTPAVEAGFGEVVVTMRELQRHYAAWALARHDGHKRHTCEALDIDIKTLNRLLE